ncbi:hypothetical protein ACMDCR_01400 [Labrys okinawensis]|uniref:hypothetical protein n=1 Tax=Labrys okinawensis TaxID=346911 RepID=UPI0039BD1299
MDYALSNRLDLAAGSAQDFAKACGLPASAISRLVRKFGFSSFAQFRALFREEIRAEFHRRVDSNSAREFLFTPAIDNS